MIASPFLLHALLLSMAASPGTSGPDAAGSPGPTLAVEDTMHTSVSEVLIRAPRVTLNEILDRVARGEARRDSLILDQTFRSTVRLVSNTSDARKAPQLESEHIVRVYKKRPGRVRWLTLREWHRKPNKPRNLIVGFRSDMSEEIVNFAFRPEARRDYKYRIVGRDLAGNNLIYRIAFEPRSALDPSNPSGRVWVNTNEFVIVRQEVDFDRSPVPLFLKGINRMVIERRREGVHWVLNRLLLRAEMTLPMPGFGRSFDLAMQFDEYAVNSGLPDSLFVSAKR
ncbi:MAG: hypothetical protein ABIS67_06835 [Candidatus Eisenbacteria bacterium]